MAEVPYQLPPLPRDAKECPICQQKLKTHHRLMHHMGVHRGEKYPCEKCGKVLATKGKLRAHVPACVQGRRMPCTDCNKTFASAQGMRQHYRAIYGADAPERDESFPFPHCTKSFSVKKSMREHSVICSENPNRKGSFFAGFEAALLLITPSQG